MHSHSHILAGPTQTLCEGFWHIPGRERRTKVMGFPLDDLHLFGYMKTGSLKQFE